MSSLQLAIIIIFAILLNNTTHASFIFCRYVLKNIETLEMVYYHSYNTSSNNTSHFFEEPFSFTDVERDTALLQDQVTLEKLRAEAFTFRPDTKWVVESVTNVSAFLTHTGALLWHPSPPSDDSGDDDDDDVSDPDDDDKPSPVRRILKKARFGHNPFAYDEAESDGGSEMEEEGVSDAEGSQQDSGDELLEEDGPVSEKKERFRALLDTKDYGKDLCFFYALAYLQWRCRQELKLLKLDAKTLLSHPPSDEDPAPPPRKTKKARKVRSSEAVITTPQPSTSTMQATTAASTSNKFPNKSSKNVGLAHSATVPADRVQGGPIDGNAIAAAVYLNRTGCKSAKRPPSAPPIQPLAKRAKMENVIFQDERQKTRPNMRLNTDLQPATEALFKKFSQHCPHHAENFTGVTIPMIADIEKLFECRIDIYQRLSYPGNHRQRAKYPHCEYSLTLP